VYSPGVFMVVGLGSPFFGYLNFLGDILPSLTGARPDLVVGLTDFLPEDMARGTGDWVPAPEYAPTLGPRAGVVYDWSPYYGRANRRSTTAAVVNGLTVLPLGTPARSQRLHLVELNIFVVQESDSNSLPWVVVACSVVVPEASGHDILDFAMQRRVYQNAHSERLATSGGFRSQIRTVLRRWWRSIRADLPERAAVLQYPTLWWRGMERVEPEEHLWLDARNGEGEMGVYPHGEVSVIRLAAPPLYPRFVTRAGARLLGLSEEPNLGVRRALHPTEVGADMRQPGFQTFNVWKALEDGVRVWAAMPPDMRANFVAAVEEEGGEQPLLADASRSDEVQLPSVPRDPFLRTLGERLLRQMESLCDPRGVCDVARLRLLPPGCTSQLTVEVMWRSHLCTGHGGVLETLVHFCNTYGVYALELWEMALYASQLCLAVYGCERRKGERQADVARALTLAHPRTHPTISLLRVGLFRTEIGLTGKHESYLLVQEPLVEYPMAMGIVDGGSETWDDRVQQAMLELLTQPDLLARQPYLFVCARDGTERALRAVLPQLLGRHDYVGPGRVCIQAVYERKTQSRLQALLDACALMARSVEEWRRRRVALLESEEFLGVARYWCSGERDLGGGGEPLLSDTYVFEKALDQTLPPVMHAYIGSTVPMREITQHKVGYLNPERTQWPVPDAHWQKTPAEWKEYYDSERDHWLDWADGQRAWHRSSGRR
jgi:hypothetical protein